MLLLPPCRCPARCIEGLKFTTTTGQSLSVGDAGSYVSKVLSEAYVFGFKGTAGGHTMLKGPLRHALAASNHMCLCPKAPGALHWQCCKLVLLRSADISCGGPDCSLQLATRQLSLWFQSSFQAACSDRLQAARTFNWPALHYAWLGTMLSPGITVLVMLAPSTVHHY